MVANQLAISRRSVGERSAIDWRSVGDWLATVSWAFVFDCRKSATFFRSVGNRSATGRQLKTVSGLSTNAAAISCQPVGNLSATAKNLSEKFYLRQPKPLCDKIVPATFCNQSATSLQPPCKLPTTTRNFGRKEVADWLQAMCDRGLREHFSLKHWHNLNTPVNQGPFSISVSDLSWNCLRQRQSIIILSWDNLVFCRCLSNTILDSC